MVDGAPGWGYAATKSRGSGQALLASEGLTRGLGSEVRPKHSAGLLGIGNEITDGNMFWKTTFIEITSFQDPGVYRVFMIPF